MLTTVWAVAASPVAQLTAAVVGALLVRAFSRHKDASGKLDAPRLSLAFGVAGSVYTWLVCILAQLGMRGNPTISTLVEHGFGNDRIAWLLVIVAADGVLRLIKLYAD